jgi:prolyl-tRNA synthetase
MRASRLLLPTVKEDPAGAEAVSHKLMVRAGLVRQLGAGIYVFLPAGWRVMQKVEQIIREEMDAIGCQELLMPVLHPAEIWQESGRYDEIGDEMFRLTDRKGSPMVLAMTHEEVITWLAARELQSYKQLPQLWYHFQTKERDEARPKSGILRTREFIMKDSYSLDTSHEALQESYDKHIVAYDRIFARCGVHVIMVQSDPGMMGGATAHEYMAFSEAGEDEVAFCRACGYAANLELARAGDDRVPPESELQAAGSPGPASADGEPVAHDASGTAATSAVSGSSTSEAPAAPDTSVATPFGEPVVLTEKRELHTPGTRTIAEVGAYLGLPARAFVKALVVMTAAPEGGGAHAAAPVSGAAAAMGAVGAVDESADVAHMVLVRGDHELNEPKLRRVLGEFRMATGDEVLAAQGVEAGFVGPDPTPLPLVADEVLRRGYYVAGANKADHHLSGVSVAGLPGVAFHDLRSAREDDPCPQCDDVLETAQVIEVGNIFQLGTKYSAPMGATYLDEHGAEKPIVMGSYGIGLARIAAAAVEQHHDKDGIAWPASIAPWHVHLVLVRASDDTQRELAERLYDELPAAGFEVLYDDRELSPGIKFKDADLLGCPAQVVVGKRAGEGVVEVKSRVSGERRDVPVHDLGAELRALLAP